MASVINANTSGGLISTADTSGILKLQTAGTDAVTIDASQRVGLGVTPSAWGSSYKALEVGGVVSYFSSANQYFGMYANAYRNSGGSYVYTTTGVSSGYIQDLGAHQWFTAASGTAGATVSYTQAMTLNASGYLGVGTASPISIANFSFAGGGISGTHSFAFGYPYAANLQLKSTNAGASASVASVGLYSNPERTKEFAFFNQADDSKAGHLGFQYASGGSITSLSLNNALAGALTFGTNNTERARIDSSGQLMVGTTAGNASAGGIHATGPILQGAAGLYQQQISINSGNRIQSLVLGVGYTDLLLNELGGNVLFGTANVPSASYGGAALCPDTSGRTTLKLGTTTTSSVTLASFWNPNGAVGTIQTNGSATSYVTSSDYRLKENIAPMTGALSLVQQLNPVTYNWKVDGSDGQGFIAHELQSVVPDAVVGAKDATEIQQYEITPAVPATYDEEGNELTPAVEAVMGEREVPVYQGIDTSFLVATLTAAIKEMKEIIDQQSERITALEGAAQ